jgi:predicted membrane-bound spermidine synthase
VLKVPQPLRPLLAILVLGAFSQVAQAVLIREALVVFYGNEVSLGAFYASWLLWLAMGSVAALGWGEGRAGAPWRASAAVRRILLALPLALVAQVLALRSVRLVLDVSASEFVPLGDLFLSLTLVTLPSGVLLGLAFPLTCKALAEAGHGVQAGPGRVVGLVARTYMADALGALLGGVLFTFVLIHWLGPVQTLGLVTAALALTAAVLPPPPAKAGRAVWLPWGMALAALGLSAPPIAARLDRGLETWRFTTLQPGMELLDAVDTRYGHVAVARLGDQISVVGDGQIHQSFPLPLEVERQAALFYAEADGARRVLLLGGYSSGLAAGLLRYPLERLDQVEQDRTGFERVRPYLDPAARDALEDPRLVLHFADGRRFLRHLGPDARYGLVLSLDAAPSSAASNRYFTREAFALVREHLAPDGVFCTQVSAASNYLGRAVGGYAGSVYRTLGEVFAQVVVVPGDVQVFCASNAPGRLTEDPAELQRRYLAAALAKHSLPVGTFASVLPREEVAQLRAQLDQVRALSEVNRDARPVTYYLNMVLWGKFSASAFVDWLERLHGLGPWPYLIPPVLLVGLWLLRAGLEGRGGPAQAAPAGVFALGVLGLIAMAAQLALLFSYQAQVGLVFERVALLNGLFMTGLALGAGLARPLAEGLRSAWYLVTVLAVVALGLVLLPSALDALAAAAQGLQEAGYLGLALTVGLLAGAGFTLSVTLAHGGRPWVVRSGGLVQAADNLGGAIGGLVTGALMVPILGVEGTCRVLAGVAAVAVLPLLFARLAPAVATGPDDRGQPSFPWPGLGWGLIYVVLLVYAFTLLGLGTRPQPQVRFDDERLAQVSGSASFTLAERPFVHYLGSSPGEAEPQTVSLASAAATPGVSGFAGPIHLLLGVGRDGVLRGVRYLDSGETPSYIGGIDAWLAGLSGADLNKGPLSLERLDGMTGATVTSRAALGTINRAAGLATQTAFARAVPATEAPGRAGEPDWGLYATAVLLLLFFPVYLSGSEPARLLFQAAALAILGLWLNTLITEVDLVNLSLGKAASLAENPQRWLLLGFAAVTTLLFGQVWCGYLCPFGALQELISRLGRRLGLRVYPDRPLEQRMRYIKYVLLAIVLTVVWTTEEGTWATFDPMQHAFGGRLSGWMLWLTGLVLIGAGFHYRFWCRYFCPMGAFLALGNKLALLQRLAPKRRFEHCDLGVKGEFDLDCIRCNRCLARTDTRVRRPTGRSAQQVP